MKAKLAAALIMVAGCGGGSKKEPTPPTTGDNGSVESATSEGSATDTGMAEVKKEPPPPPPPPDTGGYKLVMQSDLQWTPLSPDGKGPEMAVVDGNPQEGPSKFFLRVPAGGKAGAHTHTADYQAVVVSGAPKHFLAGGEKKAKPLEVGSHWFQPGGQPHDDQCTGADPCMLFVISDGKFDFTPTPKAKAPKVGKYKLTNRKDDKFAPMDPSNPKGPSLSVVFGDPKTGPVGFIIEVPAGGVSPIHSHTASYHAVVLDGAPYHWLPHEKDNADGFGNGTYWMQPGGYNHGDRCNSDTPCHAFVYFDGPLDFKAAEDPKAAK
jgi:quercetin dioxygenase-like cupin family protein